MANIRTIDYKGSNSASAGTGPKGWMFWSGSETIGGQAYSGLGMEMMDTSESYLKFTTEGGGDLDIRAKKFYVGSPSTQFISGSDGNIEISSSNFHLSGDSLIIGSNTVINANISVNSLFVPAGKTASNAKAYIDQSGDAKFVGDGSGNYVVDFSTGSAKIAGFDITSTAISASGLHLSSSGEITGSNVKFTGGKIGDWHISGSALKASSNGEVDGTTRIELLGKTTPEINIYGPSSPGENEISIFSHASNWGINGKVGNNSIFRLGSTNEIAGWTFDSEKLTADNIILSSSGTIQTTDFQSSLFGTGHGWKIGSDGIAEFEEARIRGTLSTAVFEKETISAVGGAVIIANATTISGSDILSGATTFSVASSAGFVAGEYLVAKATSSTGFTEETFKVESVAAGQLMVSRSGAIPTMSSGQVIVSKGASGSGFIMLNGSLGANTPYMEMALRTGSGIDDLETKVMLGNLGSLASSTTFGDLSGQTGLYTDNVYLKGAISASAGEIGGWSIGATKLSTGGFEIATSGSNDYAISSSNFTVKHNGLVAAANFAEKFVTVVAGNSSSYFSDNGTGVNLIFDGSGGGEVTMNMQLDVPPRRANGIVSPIKDIILPLQATGVKMEATVIVNTGSVEFDEGAISGGSAAAGW